MLAQGGTYYVIGYGGRLDVPLADLLAREISIVTNLVGNDTELEELIAIAANQRVRLENNRNTGSTRSTMHSLRFTRATSAGAPSSPAAASLSRRRRRTAPRPTPASAACAAASRASGTR